MYTTNSSSNWVMLAVAAVLGIALMFAVCVCFPLLPSRTKDWALDRMASGKVGRTARKAEYATLRARRAQK